MEGDASDYLLWAVPLMLLGSLGVRNRPEQHLSTVHSEARVQRGH